MRSQNLENKIEQSIETQSASLILKLSGLAEKIQAGNAEAFEEFYEASAKYVYSNIKITAPSVDESTAEDIMQEVFKKVFTGIAKLENTGGAVKWLKTITVNTTRDYFRKGSVKHETLLSGKSGSDDDDDGDMDDFSGGEADELLIPENFVESEATREIVKQAIRELSPDEQMILAEFYYNESPVKEIAAQMGMTEGAVKTKLSRIRKALKEKFLKIEKEQGIRLHSVGAAPVIVFLIYEFMKEDTLSAGVSASVKTAVFSSAAVKSAAAAVTAVNTTAAASASSAGAGAIAAGSAASGAAKAAGLSAGVKGIIIGVAAAAAVAGGVTVRNVMKTDEVVVESTETETTVAETETETEPVDETAVLYSAYYDKLLELQEEYGSQSFESYSEGGYIYSCQQGLCVAKLLDFTGDGTQDLFLCYANGSGGADGYTVEVWSLAGESLERLYSGPASSDSGGGASCGYVMIDGEYYIEVYEIDTDGNENCYYWKYSEGEFFCSGEFLNIGDSGSDEFDAWTDSMQELEDNYFILYSIDSAIEGTDDDDESLEDEACSAAIEEVFSTITDYLGEDDE